MSSLAIFEKVPHPAAPYRAPSVGAYVGAGADRFQKSFEINFVGHENGVPYGIRTRAANVKGWCPRPLDERDKAERSRSLAPVERRA